MLGSELGRLPEVIRPTTRVIFFETPTNPNMEVLDVAHIAAAGHKRGVLTVVDNTFATPVNQSPLALGADIVVHSTTKYLGGHSDLTGGAVIGPKALLEPIWMWRKNLGQMMAPEVAFLLARSLRTLVVRVRAHNAPRQAVAPLCGNGQGAMPPRCRAVRAAAGDWPALGAATRIVQHGNAMVVDTRCRSTRNHAVIIGERRGSSSRPNRS